MKYKDLTLKDIEEAVADAFKDYKDPTEHMTLGQKIEFDKAVKRKFNKLYNK